MKTIKTSTHENHILTCDGLFPWLPGDTGLPMMPIFFVGEPRIVGKLDGLAKPSGGTLAGVETIIKYSQRISVTTVLFDITHNFIIK